MKNQIEKDSHCANLLTPDQSPNEKQKVIRVKNQIRRPFATDGGGVVYNQGFRLPPECGSSDLKPALEYKSGQSDMDAKKLESFFIERVAKFACACINQRCNGTIAFGVGDNKVSLLTFISTATMQ